MLKPPLRLVLAAILWMVSTILHAQPRGDADIETPFFKARDHQTRYAGPPGETAVAVDEVLIGYFGPSDADDLEYGSLWSGAQRAVTEANRAGGFRGAPFRLIAAWSPDPWGTGVKQLTSLVYKQKVWAVIGGVDGPTTHLAEQVVAKARLPLVSPLSTDKTVNLANVPWAFSLAPGDHLLAPRLAAAIRQHAGAGDLVMLSTDDHDARVATAELRKSLQRYEIAPALQFEYARGFAGLSVVARKAIMAGPSAVAISANLRDTLQMLLALRNAGYAGPVFTGPAAARPWFIDQAGNASDRVIFPLLWQPTERFDAFCRERIGAEDPPAKASHDFVEALAYDAANIVIQAICAAGLNRAAIRNEMQKRSPSTGVSGRIEWDGLGANTRSVSLGTVVDGQIVPLPRESGGEAK